MHFDIAHKRYIVLIAGGPLLLDGVPCSAKIDHRNGRILLSDQLPTGERRRSLFHELRHGWVGAHGRAEGTEADADDVAAMMDQLLEQYMQQGGDAVLEALKPSQANSLSTRATATMALREAECGYCHATTALGSISNGAPEWNATMSAFTMDRGICCEICDHITVWREACTEEGMPLGQIVPFPPPRVLSGAAAAEWLAANREVARVRMSG